MSPISLSSVDKVAITDSASIFSSKLVFDKEISVGLGLYLMIKASEYPLFIWPSKSPLVSPAI